jgi:dihydroflavonol-4-reductase
MRISITGASGHIGANLCRELISLGHTIKVLINRTSKSLEGLNLEIVKGNLLSTDSLRELVKGSDVVIHLAAQISIRGASNRDIEQINITGTDNLLREVRKNSWQRLIHFSSIHAYCQNPLYEILNESRALAVNDKVQYNHTKAVGEQLIRQAAEEGLDAIIINPTAVIGPNDFRPSLLGQAIVSIYKNKLPALVPGGYDWVDVRDVVAGTVKAIEKGKKGERYLLSGHWKSLEELAKAIRRINTANSIPPRLPYWLARVGAPFLGLYAWMKGIDPLYTNESLNILKDSHRMISCEKAKSELDYQPRPFEETISDTIKWFAEYGML